MKMTLCSGFVVAMRAKLADPTRPTRYEWIIVSRWGSEGQHLSIALTSQPAEPGEAPIDLVPRRTVLATLQDRPEPATPLRPAAPLTFALESALPEHMTIAGDFLPAHGYARLYGDGTGLRFESVGKCARSRKDYAWQVEAERQPWMGEFIEPNGTDREFIEPNGTDRRTLSG